MVNLFYIIGASAVGKDSLINYARSQLAGQEKVVFAHRYITRGGDSGNENHVALTANEFAQRNKYGCFAMQWYSHNTWYGIGVEIEQWLASGLHVVVNGSRQYLPIAAEKFEQLIPILITADSDQLKKRLHLRGRETHSEIDKRLQQARQLDSVVEHSRLIRIENNHKLELAGNVLVSILKEQLAQCS